MLCARHIEVRLGQRSVLADLDFEAAPGELTAIIGPNGSGKTTLLRALSGELAATGEVRLNGRDIRALKPWQLAERRAVLPQATALAFPFTVREVVGLGLGAGRRQGDAALAARALARVDLGDFGGRLYQDLSGGEQQRVQLARVLCQVWSPVIDREPRWLLLDEPVSSLDIRHQLLVMGIARDFARAGGGVIAILHDLNLAALFADRVVLMGEGRIAAAGPPAEVLDDEPLSTVFGCTLRVGVPPAGGIPFVLPHATQPLHGSP
jgi:iron complex transport system ATP-binding protein